MPFRALEPSPARRCGRSPRSSSSMPVVADPSPTARCFAARRRWPSRCGAAPTRCSSPVGSCLPLRDRALPRLRWRGAGGEAESGCRRCVASGSIARHPLRVTVKASLYDSRWQGPDGEWRRFSSISEKMVRGAHPGSDPGAPRTIRGRYDSSDRRYPLAHPEERRHASTRSTPARDDGVLRDDPSLQGWATWRTCRDLGRSLAMPDIHWGWLDRRRGGHRRERRAPSRRGVGYDINCGVRLLRTELRREDLDDARARSSRSSSAPSPGAGEGVATCAWRKGACRRPARRRRVGVDRGMGEARPRERAARSSRPTRPGLARACERGGPRSAPLGPQPLRRGAAGRRDPRRAAARARCGGQVIAMIHTGSRGLGHQVCSDHQGDAAWRPARHRIERRPIASSPARRSSPVGGATRRHGAR